MWRAGRRGKRGAGGLEEGGADRWVVDGLSLSLSLYPAVFMRVICVFRVFMTLPAAATGEERENDRPLPP
jgi:hypothetical protein